jgi:cytochrome c-type biogenesis protein CcmH
MLIWIIFAAMTGAAVFALLWPLGRGPREAFADTADAASLYRAQIGEIERDVARALIGTAEAEAAKAEAARRLLRSAGDEVGAAGETEASLRRRRASSALALSCVPLLALLVYGAFGSPNTPDLPLSARIDKEPSRQDFAMSLARIEAHLAANPTDARGWSVLAPVYLRQGRFDEAARAFASAIRHGQDGAEMFAGQGEAQVLAAGGVVTAAARESLSEAVRRDPKNPRARFFLAIGQEQDGDIAGAAGALRAILQDAPEGAEWAQTVRQRLQSLPEQGRASSGVGQAQPSENPADAIARLPSGAQLEAIRGMVDGLAARLRDAGGTAAEWSRLIRSHIVLGDREAARAALMTARERLAQDAAALTQINALAAEFGLKDATP